MVVSIVKILQFDIDDGEGSVRDIPGAVTNDGHIQDFAAAVSSSTSMLHLPAVSNPTARDTPLGWGTDDMEDWSDSPTNQPALLYRYRFGWGRDEQEVFAQPGRGLGALSPGAAGQRWGNMDDLSGLLLYNEVFSSSNDGHIDEFVVAGTGKIRQTVISLSSDFSSVRQLGVVSDETTIEQFPYLVVAEPEPNSVKNPVTTDVYIRLANFTFPIASGTITLYLDEAIQPVLDVQEFFGGLGGFDTTWSNSFSFDYDTRVDVRWEFDDTDVPANKLVIRYPFYTVQDLAPPRITNVIPPDETLDFPIQGALQFDIEDFENDVDIDSLVLYVNNIRVVDGENGVLTTTRLGSNRGYTVRFVPSSPWLYGDLIPVAIFVKDTSPNQNELFFTYSFTTEESISPRLLNLDPLSCTVGVPTGTHVSADVVDGGHGLDKDSITFTLEEVERGGSILLIPIVHRDE